MSWIREEINQDLANFAKAMSINPTAMQAVNQLGDAVSFGASTLSRVQEEAIATTVSVINNVVIELWPTERCSVSTPVIVD